MSEPQVRPAVLDDAEAIAVVHHTSWVQTYSGLLPAEHWESDTVERRARRWHERLSDDGLGDLAVAVVDEQVVGFAKAGPTRRKKSVPLPVRMSSLRSPNRPGACGGRPRAVLSPTRTPRH
ncbi:GNAT family N-acetyltransferase [Promicromonospora iranensis]|uniref:RimJ/RimL family protein N-acetyltransferase n=1 Tax=Promicromonospora iranensis TaxID=1105144 RepID=A0ABU2CSQ6_9MICO|nr:hypothetical protein [Promicromonospora iranensis]MDR7384384.1 RimJ/RimL family protein N-acetyltransferase [Promicromonospora iranensis]